MCPDPKQIMSDGLEDQPVQTIERPTAGRSHEEDRDREIQITEVRPVGSYNWVKTSQPTIIVPGMTARTRTVVVSSQRRRGAICMA
jgi:hypothetical protein